MKTKQTIAALLCALIINACPGEEINVNGNAGTKFSTDYNRRGQELSAEAIQAQVGFNLGIGGVDVFGDFFTNQSTESSGENTDEVTLGIGTSLFEDNISAYVGVYNTESASVDSSLETFATVTANIALSPTVSLYRGDGDLYTFEGQLSHTVDIEVANFTVAGVLGNTDASTAVDRTYTGAVATLARSFDNINVYTDVAVSDADNRDNETVWGLGLRVKF
jgi:hypothetical protein